VWNFLDTYLQMSSTAFDITPSDKADALKVADRMSKYAADMPEDETREIITQTAKTVRRWANKQSLLGGRRRRLRKTRRSTK
jgi:hypothetical protein